MSSVSSSDLASSVSSCDETTVSTASKETSHGKRWERIPHTQCTPEQVAIWSDGRIWPTYRALRDPIKIDEIHPKYEIMADYRDYYSVTHHLPSKVAIWRDNGTLTFIEANYENYEREKRGFHLWFQDEEETPDSGFHCIITGKNDDAIAETAAFFWALEVIDDDACLEIDNSLSEFNFGAVSPEQLSQIRGGRRIVFNEVFMSIGQSVVLATRPDRVCMSLKHKFVFEDDGTAFVDALQNRRSNFGWLDQQADKVDRNDRICLDFRNLQRLLQTKHIEGVSIKAPSIVNLLPLVLHSPIERVCWNDFETLKGQQVEISPSELVLGVEYDGDFPDESLFSNLSQFDHLDFTTLRLKIFCDESAPIPDRVVNRLIDYVATRENLERLEWWIPFQSDELTRKLFSVVGEHKMLRAFGIDQCPDRFRYSREYRFDLIIPLLKQNRNIEVTNRYGEMLDGNRSVDMLNALNRFYRGSKSLGKEPPEIRSSLVKVALSNSAYLDSQRSALLLSIHTDTLCELVNDVLIEERPTEDQGTSELFEIIPKDQLKREQVARWSKKHTTPTYKLCREPRTLNELELYQSSMAIWMDNETLVYVSRDGHYPSGKGIKKYFTLTFCFELPGRKTVLEITGKSDDAIAETASFWWSLHCPEEYHPFLLIDKKAGEFDFSVVTRKQLALMFVSNEKRRVAFMHLDMTENQSVALATRPHAIDVYFAYLSYIDGGAFVEALQSRKLPFGSLNFPARGGWTPFLDCFMKPLLQLDIFEKLTLPAMEDIPVLLPFSLPLKSLNYVIDSEAVSVQEINSLNIVAKRLAITISGGLLSCGVDFVIAFLRRLAALGNFEHLEFSLNFFEFTPEHDLAERILKEFVRTITANKKLESLDLCQYLSFRNEHLKDLFESIVEHKGLRIVKIEEYPVKLDPDYTWLKRLLSRNKDIKVRDWSVYLTMDYIEEEIALKSAKKATVPNSVIAFEPSLECTNEEVSPGETSDLKRKVTSDPDLIPKRTRP